MAAKIRRARSRRPPRGLDRPQQASIWAEAVARRGGGLRPDLGPGLDCAAWPGLLPQQLPSLVRWKGKRRVSWWVGRALARSWVWDFSWSQ